MPGVSSDLSVKEHDLKYLHNYDRLQEQSSGHVKFCCEQTNDFLHGDFTSMKTQDPARILLTYDMPFEIHGV